MAPVTPLPQHTPRCYTFPLRACKGSMTSHGNSWSQSINPEQGTPSSPKEEKEGDTPNLALERLAELGGQEAVTPQRIIYRLDSAFRRETLKWI